MLSFKITADISPHIVAFEPSRLRISFLTRSEVIGMNLKHVSQQEKCPNMDHKKLRICILFTMLLALRRKLF